MRWYTIDELYPKDVERIVAAMETRGMRGSIDGLYYITLPAELLSDEQTAHAAECGPYIMAIEVEEEFLRLELLVRARGKMRCSCVHYAGPETRAWAMNHLDTIIRELDIQV